MSEHEAVPVPAQETALELSALTPASMPQLFQLAIQRGPEGVEMLVRLAALDKELRAQRAAQEFAEAMARFKATCPPVPRRTENNQFQVTRNGMKVNRRYASTEDIEATIRGPATECGLSYRWGDAAAAGGLLTLPCIVSHVGGHSVSSSMTMPLESKAGCSEQQKFGITYAYAQRYSLINAFGLTSCEEDLDGNTGEPEAPITADQVLVLEELIGRCPDGTRARLLAYTAEQWSADTLERLPASRFAEIEAGLKKKLPK